MITSIRFKNLGQHDGVSEMHFDSFPTWANWCLDVTKKVRDEERGLIFADSCGGQEAVKNMADGQGRGVSGKEVIDRINTRDVKPKIKQLIDERLNGFKVDIGTHFDVVEAPDLYHDESGMMLDSTAYFNGEESCMINMDVTNTTKPVIWIAETLAMNARFEDEYCANKGAALIAIIRACELQGVAVGIVGYSATNTMNGYTVTLKQPSDYLDEAMLINLFCDRDALHTLDFCTDAYIKDYKVYGIVTTMGDDCLYRGFSGAHNIVKIPYSGRENYGSLESAVTYYRQSIKESTNVEIK